MLDVGCGAGRNLHYLMAQGYDCSGIDRDPRTIEQIRREAEASGRGHVVDRFVVGEADALPGTAARSMSSSAAPCCTSRMMLRISGEW